MSQNDRNHNPQQPLSSGQKQQAGKQEQETGELNLPLHDNRTDAHINPPIETTQDNQTSTTDFTHTESGYYLATQDSQLSTAKSARKDPQEYTTASYFHPVPKKRPLPELVEIVKKHGSTQERVVAIRQLAMFGDQVPQAVLTRALTDPAKAVRIAALETYAELAYRFPAALVVAAFVDDEWSVRATAAWALGFFTKDTQAPLLRAIVADAGEHSLVRAAAIQTLGTLQDQRALKLLITILRNPPVEVADITPGNEDQDMNWHEREAAAHALGNIHHKDSTSALAGALKQDPSVYVRVAAIHALASINDLPAEAKTAINHATFSSSEWLRQTALKVMEERHIRAPRSPRRQNPNEFDTI